MGATLKGINGPTLSVQSSAEATALFTLANGELLGGSRHRSLCGGRLRLVLVAALTGGHGAQRGHRLRLAAAGAETYCAGHCKYESGGFHKKNVV